MALDLKNIMKLLSPRLVSKALRLLDKSTAVVVGVTWVSAILGLIVASYSVHAAAAARSAVAAALASQPTLPALTSTPVPPQDVRQAIEKLQRQFPDVKVETDGAGIVVKSDDGSKFHEWVTALSYIDSMVPQVRWSIVEFCVGHCGGGLMKASVSGQKISFTQPPL